ncbi:MAG: hypothetical protein HYX68_07270 [Planctomycetes bacterium]|jgi:uncharacterized membrane protein YozB (DUF420 family)|nr:hypothetical protein [Planctomycetota bacterium]
MDAGLVILILKIAVGAVTVLWIASLVALALGKTRLHGRINLAFFALTLAALIGLEVIANIISPGLFDEFLQARDAKNMLRIHLCFSMPAAALLFVMLFTGLKHHRRFHIATGVLFSVLWIGTFVTGIFFLPHE